MMLSQNRHGILTQCLAQRFKALAQSKHFILYGLKPDQKIPVPADDLIVVHNFEPPNIDNNIGYHVANELMPMLAGLRETHQLSPTERVYALSEQQIFERYVGEIVRSMDGNETRAWHKFYDNTLRALTKLAKCHTDNEASSRGQPGSVHTASNPRLDFISNFGAIYRCTQDLIDISCPTELLTLLDVATCFGFFPLFLVQRQAISLAKVVGCDNNPALVDLANGYAQEQRLGQVRFVVADILTTEHKGLISSMVPFDVVTAIHLLEHLEPQQTGIAIANLWKLTGRRLIISVPFEEIPDKRFGHQQVFDRESLLAIGQRLSTSYRYFENRGGWIVIDRPPTLKQHSPRRSYHHAKVSH